MRFKTTLVLLAVLAVLIALVLYFDSRGEKKKAAEAPATGEGMAKPDKKEVKKSEKSKKRQAQTPEKKKAAEAPATGEGMAAPPAPAKK